MKWFEVNSAFEVLLLSLQIVGLRSEIHPVNPISMPVATDAYAAVLVLALAHELHLQEYLEGS